MDRRAAIERAERLAEALRQRGPAGRADLRAVLSSLFAGNAPWADRLSRTRCLLAALKDTWLVERSGTAYPRACRVGEVIGEYLSAPVPEAEARFVLGWCSRIVAVLERTQPLARGPGGK